MKISIITVCLNSAKTIERTINSVLSQYFRDIEYIIIDGASSDGTVDIINRYSGHIAHFISEADNGMRDALNKGIRLATGEVVGFLNSSDCFYSDNTLSDIAAFFNLTNIDLLYGNGIYVNRRTGKPLRNFVSSDYHYMRVCTNWLPLHPTVYLRRTVFERCGYYSASDSKAGDSDMLVQLLYNEELSVYYLKEYIVRMGWTGISASPIAAKPISNWRTYKRQHR